MKFIDDNPDYFSAPITRKIRTSLKNVKKHLIDGRNGSISASLTKTIWTANIAPEKGIYLRYKVIFERQLEQNGDSTREALDRDKQYKKRLNELTIEFGVNSEQALERDKQYKKRLNELTAEFGANSDQVKKHKAENHPTTGSLVTSEAAQICHEAGKCCGAVNTSPCPDGSDAAPGRNRCLPCQIVKDGFTVHHNGLESKHICQRKWKEDSDSRRKGIAIPNQPYAELLLEKAVELQDFVNNHSGLSATLSNPSNIVSVDTAAKNRSRQGVDLISFLSYSHKSKTWFFGYIKGSGWQVNCWRAGPNSFKNPAFTISKTEHTVSEAMALYAEFVGGCTVLGYEANDELRINSWLRSEGVEPLTFLDLGCDIMYSTNRAVSVFGEHGIVKTPNSVLTSIVTIFKKTTETSANSTQF
ncbi:hypothetical protein HK100_006732 [Physocladia obscura]|uniref:Uncharacterized protein n=1 Tax=Physocladia obscura TaxID=109957 RepID=A0AAD5SQ35_9FUNG|nr:hypothetical protein HK100_006732 [Physocladia obscura]